MAVGLINRLLFVIVALFSVNLASAASRQEIINACHTNASETVCIGYNSKDADSRDDCSLNPETCYFAFAAISKAPGSDGGYLVQLVGKGSGWVGLGFSDDETQVMRADNLAVVCVNRLQPPVRILRIQDRDASGRQTAPKIPFTFDDSGHTESIRGSPTVTFSDGWMVCEFVLSAKPRHSARTLDLGVNSYKLALAGHEQYGADTSAGANQPVYHQRKGSSAKKVDAFQRVSGAMGSASSSAVTMGLSLVLMALISKHVL